MYRYARGQSGASGPVSRPAWGGSGAHGARAASPEGIASPGGHREAAAVGSEFGKERQDNEVILQLENDLIELRNQMAWKDQQIAALARTHVPVPRLKRDVRLLTGELHQARKQLNGSRTEAQELSDRLHNFEVAGGSSSSASIVAPTNAAASASSIEASGCDPQLPGRISALSEENRQLRDMVAELRSQVARQNATNSADGGCCGSNQQPWSASPHTAPELPLQSRPMEAAPIAASGLPVRPQYMAGASSVATAPAGLPLQVQDESFIQEVYSNLLHEQMVTIGPTMLQGVGTVDGVASVAKVLLQRIPCSVCYMHGHPAGYHIGGGGYPMGMMGAPA